MRIGPRITLLTLLLLSTLALAACGTPGIDRIDVTWDTDPPPRWGLYPGYRQEIPCPKGATYRVDIYSKGKTFTGAAIAATSGGLAFKPIAGARDIEAEAQDATHMTVYATLRDKNGQASRLLALRIERRGDKIYFEFPK